MLQFDLEKAYGHVRCSFCQQWCLNFGPHMSRLAQNATLHVILGGSWVTQKNSLNRLVRQGGPLNPLLFVIASHNLLVMLLSLARCGDIMGLHLSYVGKLVT